MVDITSTPGKHLLAEPPGQSAPGAAAAPGSEPGAGQTVEAVQPGAISVYASDAYRFQVGYPANFVAATVPADKLSQLEPPPVAAFTFMNPVTAASEVVELEPADLEIRVYPAGQAPSLEGWLNSSGKLATFGNPPLQPVQTPNLSGVQVCATTMLAPGCSDFFLGNGWAYELIPVTLEGEGMVQTFRLQ